MTLEDLFALKEGDEFVVVVDRMAYDRLYTSEGHGFSYILPVGCSFPAAEVGALRILKFKEISICPCTPDGPDRHGTVFVELVGDN